MRLAVIADVHGNLPALETILADIARRGADLTINLGDCVSGPLWPREAMDLLESSAIPSVRGNHDRWVAETPRERMYPSDAHAFDRLTPEQRRALGALPPRIELDGGIVAVHGTPSDDNAYLLEDIVDGCLVLSRPQQIAARLEGASASLLLCAHSHKPRVVYGPAGMTILNPGSVGCPAYADPTPPPHVSESGSPHARYALATLHADRWSVELIAVEYDWASASKLAADNGRPEWARALATGYVT
ncbi:MAG TPA: metallophosphoesterase family protein [Hyphomicrobiaceae bacterium]